MRDAADYVDFGVLFGAVAVGLIVYPICFYILWNFLVGPEVSKSFGRIYKITATMGTVTLAIGWLLSLVIEHSYETPYRIIILSPFIWIGLTKPCLDHLLAEDDSNDFTMMLLYFAMHGGIYYLLLTLN